MVDGVRRGANVDDGAPARGAVPHELLRGDGSRPLTRDVPRARLTRWQKSALAFGPAGRLVATVLVLLFLVFLAVAFPPGFVLCVLLVAPPVLRDVWRRVPRRGA